ncbi:MAG: [FeFe] hydrogenase H-cluster radical SAM maturase HydE [Rikenellaceae bacterium]
MRTREWIDLLRDQSSLPSEGYRALLESRDDEAEYLFRSAREVADRIFGREVFVRGLIEITNRCRNNCYYCGIRASNREVERYSLSRDQILECCRRGDELGFRTFVFQGGEDPTMSDEWLIELVERVRKEYPTTAITLSLGERSRDVYEWLFEAGANRYLLRHESCNAEHYGVLHPSGMSIESRVHALEELRDIGYQVGTGIMVGSPHQTIDHIIEDVEYIERFKPQMVGIGPFIPHHATPFAHYEAGGVGLTLKLISIFRLINPTALIPSTTALATLSKDGRERGILAGANVVMPNISPTDIRSSYSLYDNKAAFGAESGEGLSQLGERLSSIGYSINFDRGDYRGVLSSVK